MAYREENNQVILTMSREDYEQLLSLLCSRVAAGEWGRTFDPQLKRIKGLSDRLNSGNPSYTPYQLPEKSS
jgi:hypothetical protein